MWSTQEVEVDKYLLVCVGLWSMWLKYPESISMKTELNLRRHFKATHSEFGTTSPLGPETYTRVTHFSLFMMTCPLSCQENIATCLVKSLTVVKEAYYVCFQLYILFRDSIRVALQDSKMALFISDCLLSRPSVEPLTDPGNISLGCPQSPLSSV